MAILASLAVPAVGAGQSTTEQVSAPLAGAPAQSAAGFEIAAIGGLRTVTAVESAVAPVLDGAVLDDPAWANAPPATGFVQTQPEEGRPASERTEVRIVYTADTIYFGVVCYDSDPASIIVTDSRRDSSLADSDSFQLILDTFLDRQNGFIFGTSPSGQEYDGQLVNEGAGGSGMGRFGAGGQIGGAGGGFNQNWDGVWQVRTAITDVGWTAEFAIPFRTLRFPAGREQTWGVNFQRNIRRRNEEAYWAPLPRQYDLFRVSLAGQLGGVRAPEGLWRTLQMTPYVIGETVNRVDRPDGRTLALGAFGGDLKYGVTSGLALDLTYNTDFAQVEVDDQQINLDRFQLFFPEKRPFFLENAGAFTVTNSGGAAFNDPGQTDLFFSRRIGIGAAGQAIPILGGARLSGRVSEDVTVGFLNMQTEAVGSATPANNFTVARLRHDLPNRSSIGGLLVNRQATGPLAGTDNYNRTYAFDGRWGFGQNGLLSGFAARTETPFRAGRHFDQDHAFDLAFDYNTEAWRLRGSVGEMGRDFNPEVGFVRRTGFRKMGRRHLQHLPAAIQLAPDSGAAAARHVQPVLGHRDRLHPDLAAPHGQRLGVRGQLEGDHRLERSKGGRDPAVHYLRGAGGPRFLRLARDQPQLQLGPLGPLGLRVPLPAERVLRRRPAGGRPHVQLPPRRGAERRAALDT